MDKNSLRAIVGTRILQATNDYLQDSSAMTFMKNQSLMMAYQIINQTHPVQFDMIVGDKNIDEAIECFCTIGCEFFDDVMKERYGAPMIAVVLG